MQPSRIGDVSFWYADLGGLPQKRPPLDGDMAVDVCIIGAGCSGFTTANTPPNHFRHSRREFDRRIAASTLVCDPLPPG